VRALGDELQSWLQPLVIENRPGEEWEHRRTRLRRSAKRQLHPRILPGETLVLKPVHLKSIRTILKGTRTDRECTINTQVLVVRRR
jgi:hypothetical protein